MNIIQGGIKAKMMIYPMHGLTQNRKGCLQAYVIGRYDMETHDVVVVI